MAKGGSSGGPTDSDDSSQGRQPPVPKLAPWQVKLAQSEFMLHIRDRLRVSDVAAKLQLSVAHFSKAFRNSVGMTPHCWLRRERIAHSLPLLADERKPLAEIAVECGFTDESHFITTFHKEVGLTPGRWRRSASRD